MNASALFMQQLQQNRLGQGGVAVSVCSAHPFVLRAAFRAAKQHQSFALIESTSNQVDQYGGYTGMRPDDFVALVKGLAKEENFSWDQVLLGGDHLGTNTWRNLGSTRALEEACELVKNYVQAGYRKIHLDASFLCSDDNAPLSNEIVAERCAQMAIFAERAADKEHLPFYVIGTEVPTPGGTRHEEQIHITSSEDVEKTLSVFRDTFLKHGLENAWERVIGLVIQPGVEFGDAKVHDYSPSPALKEIVLRYPSTVYEAHSTDYQTAVNLARLAKNHFYIQKVGPWLTFALREAFFLLECIEGELQVAKPSHLRATLMRTMKEDPKYWKAYYSGNTAEIDYKLAFSYSDRARYYLAQVDVQSAIAQLMENLKSIPEALISQYLPAQYSAVREGVLRANAEDLAIDRVSAVLSIYYTAGDN